MSTGLIAAWSCVPFAPGVTVHLTARTDLTGAIPREPNRCSPPMT